MGYNGTKVLEVTLGKPAESRLSRKIRHRVNFHFRIQQVIPLETSDQASFLLRDTTGDLFVLSGSRAENTQTLNRFLSNGLSCQKVLSTKDGVLLLQEHTISLLQTVSALSVVRDLLEADKFLQASKFVAVVGLGKSLI